MAALPGSPDRVGNGEMTRGVPGRALMVLLGICVQAKRWRLRQRRRKSRWGAGLKVQAHVAGCGSAAPPNTRMQRTRSSPSALRSPLMRCPLGGGSEMSADRRLVAAWRRSWLAALRAVSWQSLAVVIAHACVGGWNECRSVARLSRSSASSADVDGCSIAAWQWSSVDRSGWSFGCSALAAVAAVDSLLGEACPASSAVAAESRCLWWSRRRRASLCGCRTRRVPSRGAAA